MLNSQVTTSSHTIPVVGQIGTSPRQELQVCRSWAGTGFFFFSGLIYEVGVGLGGTKGSMSDDG